jgi:hypothetical protein
MGMERTSEAAKPRRGVADRNVEVEQPTAPAGEMKLSKLEKTLEDRESVTNKVLQKDVAIYIKTEADRDTLIEGLAKSVFAKVLIFADMVATLKEKVSEEASAIVVAVLQWLFSAKGEVILMKILVHSKMDVIAIIATGLEGDALDSFLIEKDLLCLKPVPDLSVDIKKALAAGDSPADVLKLINSKIDDKLSAAIMVPAVTEALGLAIFKATPPAIDQIELYAPLLKRVLAPKDLVAQKDALLVLTGAWNTAKLPKGVIKSIFEAMQQHVGIGHEVVNLMRFSTHTDARIDLDTCTQILTCAPI